MVVEEKEDYKAALKEIFGKDEYVKNFRLLNKALHSYRTATSAQQGVVRKCIFLQI